MDGVSRSVELLDSPVRTQKPRASADFFRGLDRRYGSPSPKNASNKRSNESHSSFDEHRLARSAEPTALESSGTARNASTAARGSVIPAANPLSRANRQNSTI